MNLGMILAIVAVWLWFCLVMLPQDGAHLTAAILFPMFWPIGIAFNCLEWCFKKLGDGLMELIGFIADSERSIGQ